MLRIELYVYAGGQAEAAERQNAAQLLQTVVDYLKLGHSLPDAISAPEQGNLYCKIRREP